MKAASTSNLPVRKRHPPQRKFPFKYPKIPPFHRSTFIIHRSPFPPYNPLMTFPVYFHLFGHRIHPHPVMEGLGYLVALTATFIARKRGHELTTPKSLTQTLWLTAAAALGALVGAKILAWLESLPLLEGPATPTLDNFLTGGKTIVGGLAGAWLATELAKKILHISQRTGDPWVLPLCAAIAIGRIGCFLTGLSDNTYGNHTTLPWAIDFGDGPRHPTQLYESAFALTLFTTFFSLRKHPLPPGTRFRLFILAYMLFRFLIEFLKPTHKPYLGLSAIQIVTLIVSLCAVLGINRIHKIRELNFYLLI